MLLILISPLYYYCCPNTLIADVIICTLSPTSSDLRIGTNDHRFAIEWKQLCSSLFRNLKIHEGDPSLWFPLSISRSLYFCTDWTHTYHRFWATDTIMFIRYIRMSRKNVSLMMPFSRTGNMASRTIDTKF